MKYASEVIDLMECYPGREFRMAQIVNYVSPGAVGAGRQRVRNGVARVLSFLHESGQVEVTPSERRGSGAAYSWRKVPHAVDAKCHAKCHNRPV